MAAIRSKIKTNGKTGLADSYTKEQDKQIRFQQIRERQRQRQRHRSISFSKDTVHLPEKRKKKQPRMSKESSGTSPYTEKHG
jgi:hypothetical protein